MMSPRLPGVKCSFKFSGPLSALLGGSTPFWDQGHRLIMPEVAGMESTIVQVGGWE